MEADAGARQQETAVERLPERNRINFRYLHPDLHFETITEAYRVPGFPFTTGLVLVASVAFFLGSVVTDWGNSWKSLLLLGLSYPVYRGVVRGRGSRV